MSDTKQEPSALDYLLMKEYDILDNLETKATMSNRHTDETAVESNLMSINHRGFSDEIVARIKQMR